MHIAHPGGLPAGTQDNLQHTYVYDSGTLSWVPMTQPAGGTGGTASTDDAGFTAAVGSGTPMMGFVTADSVDVGDVGVVGMLANRQLKVTLYDSAGVELAVGGGTQYTEDAAAAANPVGTALILVREDARAGGLTSADGDNVAARGNDKGELYVKHTDAIPVTDNSGSLTVDGTVAVSSVGGTVTVAAHAVTNAGTFAVQESGSQVQVDDAAFTPATSKVLMAGAEFDDTLPDSVDEGDGGALRMSANRNLYVRIRDNAGNERGMNVDANGDVGVTARSGAFASGALASGSIASGAIAAGAIAAGATSIADNEDVASADGDRGVKILAVRKATPANTSGTDGDYEFLQLSAGRLWTSAVVDTALPTGSNTIGNVNPGTAANWGVYVEDAAETAGGNLVMAGAVRRDTAASSSGTTGDNSTLNVDALGKLWTTGSYAEDTAHTAADTLTAVATRRIDTAASSAGTSGDYATLDQSAEGALWATLTPTTTSGCSTFMASGSDGSSILVATAQAIKASAGVLYGYYAYNPEAAVTFVHFYNTAAASVTVGTTNPLFTIQLPAGAAANLSLPYGITFSNAGWSCAATTTAGGNTAPATGVSLTCWYK